MENEKKKQYRQPLGAQADTVEQEARMVLPGIQALFGFQLIVVFTDRFRSSLSATEQAVHLIALLLVVCAAILVVAPAAYHRQADHQISKHFVELASRYLAWAMVPLALGTCLDVYLVTTVIFNSILLSLFTSAIIFCMYLWFWFLFPRLSVQKIKSLPTHPLADQET